MQHDQNIKPAGIARKKLGTLKISEKIKVGNIETDTFDIMRPDFDQGFEFVGETDPNIVASILLELCSSPKITIDNLSELPDGNMDGIIAMAKHIMMLVADAIIADEKRIHNGDSQDTYKLLHPFTVAGKNIEEFILSPRTLGDIYYLKTESDDKADFAKSFIQGFCKIKGHEDEPVLDAIVERIDFIDAITLTTTISRKKSQENTSSFTPASE